VQLTPAGSACSIGMGTGNRIASLRGIEQPRAELVGRGVEVGAMEDVGGGVRYAWLADLDCNTLALQEMS
jgi:hypothetical protein